MIGLVYLCEIRARFDSAMTIQVLNDYSHLASMEVNTLLFIDNRNNHDRHPIENQRAMVAGRYMRLVWSGQRIRLLRLLQLFHAACRFLRHQRGATSFIVVRGANLWMARLLRWIFGAKILSELHEGAAPEPGSKLSAERLRRHLAIVDGLIFTTAAARDYYDAQGYTLPREVIVLPNGVYYQKFSGAVARDPAESDVVLTYMGQFTGWKNIGLLFDALARLPRQFRLRIAGGKLSGAGSAQMIKDLALAHGVLERVEFLGFVPPDRLVDEVLSGSSVLLLPLGDDMVSRHFTSPMKLIEYMATSIPVVAVDNPSVVALAGRTTVHLASGNGASFAEAILTAVGEAEPVRRERLDRMNELAKSLDHGVRARKYRDWLSGLAG